jgi:hypothetical protein
MLSPSWGLMTDEKSNTDIFTAVRNWNSRQWTSAFREKQLSVLPASEAPVCEVTSYLKENTTFLHYNDQLVNALEESNRCLLWESYENHKYTAWTKCRFEDRPDDGGSTHFENLCVLHWDLTALYRRRLPSSFSQPWECELSENAVTELYSKLRLWFDKYKQIQLMWCWSAYSLRTKCFRKLSKNICKLLKELVTLAVANT